MACSRSQHTLLQAHLLEALPCHTGVNLWQEYMDSDECLWTFDIKQRSWRQRHATGPFPEPCKTFGLAVANGRAYLLARQANWSAAWQVYELDLETWQSRLLPCDASAPPCWVRGNPAVVEVRVFSHPCLVEADVYHCYHLVWHLDQAQYSGLHIPCWYSDSV